MKGKIRYSEAFKLKVTVEMHCYENAMAALNCAARAEATPCRQTAQPKNAVLTINRDLTGWCRGDPIGFLPPAIIVVVICLLVNHSFATPRLSLSPEGIALGEFAAGEPVSGAAELRNTGDTPLRIAGVRGCCGMEAELSALSIPPGGSATLTVTLRPQPPGPVSNAVRVRCDDPANPSASIPVTGTAVAGGTVPAASSRFTLPAVLAAGLADGVRLRNRHIGFPQSSRKGNGFEDGRFLTVDSIFSK